MLRTNNVTTFQVGLRNDEIPSKGKDVLNPEEHSFVDVSNHPKYLFSISRLTDNLFLCGSCALRADTFEKLGITCVINCTTRQELQDPPLSKNVSTYHRIPVLDSLSTDLYSHFHNVIDIIRKVENEGGKTLVHCVAGVSRSPSICIAYFIKYHNLSLKESYKYVKRRRPCIRPNNSFIKQLIEFEVEDRSKESVSMVFDDQSNSYIPDIYIRMRIR